MPAIDEFGGYSSRLRIPEMVSGNASTHHLDQDTSSIDSKKSKKASTKGKKKLALGGEDGLCEASGAQSNQNLCQLLGIDVEKIALDIVMRNRGLL